MGTERSLTPSASRSRTRATFFGTYLEEHVVCWGTHLGFVKAKAEQTQEWGPFSYLEKHLFDALLTTQACHLVALRPHWKHSARSFFLLCFEFSQCGDDYNMRDTAESN